MLQMTSTHSLESPAQLAPISLDAKCSILRHLLDTDILPSAYYDGSIDYDVYFSYYTEQCSVALHDGGRHVSIRTHADILKVSQHLKKSLDRHSIKQLLSSNLPTPKPINEDELLNGSIDLVASHILMVEFGGLQYGIRGRKQVEWRVSSLEESVSNHFSTPPILGEESVKLETIFNVRNLGRIAGIEIEWTNNLANHLSLVDEDQKVVIFHNASFLESQLQRYVLRPLPSHSASI